MHWNTADRRKIFCWSEKNDHPPICLIAALPVALAHATPTQARRVRAYYIAGIRQPEISDRGVHSTRLALLSAGSAEYAPLL